MFLDHVISASDPRTMVFHNAPKVNLLSQLQIAFNGILYLTDPPIYGTTYD